MAELVLIRGIPGSGKSTMAKNDFPDHDHFEADMYFVDDNGNFKFYGSKIKKAHQWCEKSTKESLDSGRDVVVTNTFTRIWEMKAYLNMGASNVTVIEATGNWNNTHGVPEGKVKEMRDRFEPYEPEDES